MRFDVITLFPELLKPMLSLGINRRAFESGQVQVVLWNLRDFAEGNYRRVDDRPFGGGPGMVMMAEPLARCLAAVRQARADSGEPSANPVPVVLFSRWGSGLTMLRCKLGRTAQGLCWYVAATRALTSASSMRMWMFRSAWVTLCCQAARLPRWPCWMRWPACNPVC